MKIDGATVSKHRNKVGMNQAEFWSPLGVTQSGGSRYESGRNIPAPVQRLYFLTYVVGVTDGLPAKDRKQLLALGR